MGYKVTNKNAVISTSKNISTDTIFFFPTLERAKEYYQAVLEFNGAKSVENHILEPMTEEEEMKFNFEIPLHYQIPHKMIVKPLNIKPDEPYWLETKELLMPKGV